MVLELVQNFAAASGNCRQSFLGLRPWYAFLKLNTSDCSIAKFQILPKGPAASDIPLVLLAIVDDLIRVAGLLAVGFVIYGGIQYATSQGNPDQASKAQSTIINALIGLTICIIAVTAVAFLSKRLVV